MAKKTALGKGLDSLIPPVNNNVSASGTDKPDGRDGSEVLVKTSMIEPNKEQPRTNFDEDKLQELADSIKQFGLIEPLIVVDRGEHYELVAGERRWRAAMLVGLKEVPVKIMNLTDQEILEISLIENIQREDLNPIEEAKAYYRLLTEFNLKQDEVAERVSKSRTAVTNSMRLLKLGDKVQQMVIDEMISGGHARALLSIEDKEEQFRIAQRIFDEKLSVRDIEKLVRDMGKPKPEKPEKKDKDKALELVYQEMAGKLRETLGRKVTISGKENGSGKIEIEFYDNSDFDNIAGQLLKSK